MWEWQNPAGFPRKTLIFLILSALATGASWLCYYRALQLGPASKVLPLISRNGLGFYILGEKAEMKTVNWGIINYGRDVYNCAKITYIEGLKSMLTWVILFVIIMFFLLAVFVYNYRYHLIYLI
jgi:uncharacterized membrane protein